MKSRIREIFKKEFNSKVLSISKIKEGYSHDMYEVKTNKRPYIGIIRFPINLNPNISLGKEAYVIKLLNKNNIPVPKIYAYNNPKEEKDGYLILEKIEGKSLNSIWKNLSELDKIDITTKIGKLLFDMHKIKLKTFGFIREDGTTDTGKWVFKFKYESKKEILKPSPYLIRNMKDLGWDISILISYKILEPRFFSRLIYYITKNLNKLDYKGKPTFVHNDLNLDHIFVVKKNNKYEINKIIDFELANSSCPEYDFIKLHRLGFFDNKNLKKALEKGYGRKINEEVLRLNRLLRDIAFATALLQSGNRELFPKIIKGIKREIT